MKPIDVDIPCPSCHRKYKERLANIRPGNTKKCPSCSQDIQYTGDDAGKIERELKKSFDELERTIRNLNRKR